jgi:hypothetical protein
MHGEPDLIQGVDGLLDAVEDRSLRTSTFAMKDPGDVDGVHPTWDGTFGYPSREEPDSRTPLHLGLS